MEHRPKTLDLSNLKAEYTIHETPKKLLNIKISGKGEIFYDEIIKPNHVIELRGAGTRYDGVYTVKKVSHSLTNGKYHAVFSLSK